MLEKQFAEVANASVFRYGDAPTRKDDDDDDVIEEIEEARQSIRVIL